MDMATILIKTFWLVKTVNVVEVCRNNAVFLKFKLCFNQPLDGSGSLC